MKVTMELKKGEFTNDRGEKLVYVQGIAEVGGEQVRFVCKKEDKTLLKYLLKGTELELTSDAGDEKED